MSDDKKIGNKIGIVIDTDFALKNNPPYPRPMFLSYENPYRIKFILDFYQMIDTYLTMCVDQLLQGCGPIFYINFLNCRIDFKMRTVSLSRVLYYFSVFLDIFLKVS